MFLPKKCNLLWCLCVESHATSLRGQLPWHPNGGGASLEMCPHDVRFVALCGQQPQHHGSASLHEHISSHRHGHTGTCAYMYRSRRSCAKRRAPPLAALRRVAWQLCRVAVQPFLVIGCCNKVLLGAPQATPATESNQPESTNLNNVKAAGPSASPICLGIGSASASADHLCHQLCHQLCHCYTRHGEREREREREDDGERSPP